MLMCARHWRMVPKPLQTAIYETYRSGPTASHRANIAEAIELVIAAEAGRAAPGTVPGMKALTVWQPWASLIMIGAKAYEFRRWNFTDRSHLRHLVGQRIVIHAGARKPTLVECDDIIGRIYEGESALDAELALPLVRSLMSSIASRAQPSVLLAAALGTVVVGEPRRCTDLFAGVIADSDRIDEHMWAWPMTDPQPFPAPIPAAGAQGFWNWS
jgi:hypothetical protein